MLSQYGRQKVRLDRVASRVRVKMFVLELLSLFLLESISGQNFMHRDFMLTLHDCH